MKFLARARRVNYRLYDSIAVIIACLVFAAIATYALAFESSYFDEGFTSYLARFSPLEIAHYTALDVHPPLYYIALHYWQLIVGIDVFWLRFFSVIWAWIAIALSFFLVKEWFGRAAGYITLVFVTFSPLFIRYSEAMRMYTMAIAITVGATYLLTKLLQPSRRSSKQQKWMWVGYGLLVSAGMWTNYFTAFIWIAHFIWIVNERRLAGSTKNKQQYTNHLRKWLFAIGLAIIFYIPWLPWLIVRFTEVQATGFWILPVSVDTIVSTVTTSLIYLDATKTNNWMTPIICIYVGISIYAISYTYKHLNDTQRYIFRLFLLCACVPIIGLLLLSLPPFRSSFVYRYLLNGVFFMTIVMGISFTYLQFRQNNRLKKTLVAALTASVMLLAVIHVAAAGNRSLDTGVKNMVSQAIGRIHESGKPAPIISRSPYTYFTAAQYETSRYPVYYTFSETLNDVGSTHVLYDHPEKRGIKSMEQFAKTHAAIWLLSEDMSSAITPPQPGWIKTDYIVLKDPVTKKHTAYASRYEKP